MIRLSLLALTLFTSCTSPIYNISLVPKINMTPVGCGYKWFQSGYSPTTAMNCATAREHLKAAQTTKAVEHAWSVANTRCPTTCPPRELQDSIEWQNPTPQGVCRGNEVYFLTRVFFQCGS